MQLFAAFLGGAFAGNRIGEDHEIVFVVAESITEARAAAKAKWQGAGRPHVDAVVALDVVDGFEIVPRPADAAGDRFVVEGYN